MSIQVRCGNCGADYEVSDDKAGKKFKCRSCDATVRVPLAEEPERLIWVICFRASFQMRALFTNLI